jgi:N-acetylglucosaminyldiphosphoundecaprenol N-acetyl-beta-D-mannosaminyltransferase
LGVAVHAVNPESVWAALDQLVREKRKGMVCVTGMHGVMEAEDNPALREVLNTAFLNVPDGMPMSWVGWAQGHRTMDRVYGPELMLEVCRRSVERGYAHFFFGGQPGVADALRDRLCERFPGLRVTGTYTPPFRPLNAEEEADLTSRLAADPPDFFWVGISTPKQELFMARHLERLPVRAMLAVGAAFDVHTGRIADAPRWMKRAGLQWLHRLGQEPRRLGRRYLVNIPRFLWRLLRQAVGRPAPRREA